MKFSKKVMTLLFLSLPLFLECRSSSASPEPDETVKMESFLKTHFSAKSSELSRVAAVNEFAAVSASIIATYLIRQNRFPDINQKFLDAVVYSLIGHSSGILQWVDNNTNKVGLATAKSVAEVVWYAGLGSALLNVYSTGFQYGAVPLVKSTVYSFLPYISRYAVGQLINIASEHVRERNKHINDIDCILNLIRPWVTMGFNLLLASYEPVVERDDERLVFHHSNDSREEFFGEAKVLFEPGRAEFILQKECIATKFNEKFQRMHKCYVDGYDIASIRVAKNGTDGGFERQVLLKRMGDDEQSDDMVFGLFVMPDDVDVRVNGESFNNGEETIISGEEAFSGNSYDAGDAFYKKESLVESVGFLNIQSLMQHFASLGSGFLGMLFNMKDPLSFPETSAGPVVVLNKSAEQFILTAMFGFHREDHREDHRVYNEALSLDDYMIYAITSDRGEVVRKEGGYFQYNMLMTGSSNNIKTIVKEVGGVCSPSDKIIMLFDKVLMSLGSIESVEENSIFLHSQVKEAVETVFGNENELVEVNVIFEKCDLKTAVFQCSGSLGCVLLRGGDSPEAATVLATLETDYKVRVVILLNGIEQRRAGDLRKKRGLDDLSLPVEDALRVSGGYIEKSDEYRRNFPKSFAEKMKIMLSMGRDDFSTVYVVEKDDEKQLGGSRLSGDLPKDVDGKLKRIVLQKNAEVKRALFGVMVYETFRKFSYFDLKPREFLLSEALDVEEYFKKKAYLEKNVVFKDGVATVRLKPEDIGDSSFEEESESNKIKETDERPNKLAIYIKIEYRNVLNKLRKLELKYADTSKEYDEVRMPEFKASLKKRKKYRQEQALSVLNDLLRASRRWSVAEKVGSDQLLTNKGMKQASTVQLMRRNAALQHGVDKDLVAVGLYKPFLGELFEGLRSEKERDKHPSARQGVALPDGGIVVKEGVDEEFSFEKSKGGTSKQKVPELKSEFEVEVVADVHATIDFKPHASPISETDRLHGQSSSALAHNRQSGIFEGSINSADKKSKRPRREAVESKSGEIATEKYLPSDFEDQIQASVNLLAHDIRTDYPDIEIESLFGQYYVPVNEGNNVFQLVVRGYDFSSSPKSSSQGADEQAILLPVVNFIWESIKSTEMDGMLVGSKGSRIFTLPIFDDEGNPQWRPYLTRVNGRIIALDSETKRGRLKRVLLPEAILGNSWIRGDSITLQRIMLDGTSKEIDVPVVNEADRDMVVLKGLNPGFYQAKYETGKGEMFFVAGHDGQEENELEIVLTFAEWFAEKCVGVYERVDKKYQPAFKAYVNHIYDKQVPSIVYRKRGGVYAPRRFNEKAFKLREMAEFIEKILTIPELDGASLFAKDDPKDKHKKLIADLFRYCSWLPWKLSQNYIKKVLAKKIIDNVDDSTDKSAIESKGSSSDSLAGSTRTTALVSPRPTAMTTTTARTAYPKNIHQLDDAHQFDPEVYNEAPIRRDGVVLCDGSELSMTNPAAPCSKTSTDDNQGFFDWQAVEWPYYDQSSGRIKTVLSPFYSTYIPGHGDRRLTVPIYRADFTSRYYLSQGNIIPRFLPEAGWELLVANLGFTTEYGNGGYSYYVENPEQSKRTPHVVMYNRLSGRARVFVKIDQEFSSNNNYMKIGLKDNSQTMQYVICHLSHEMEWAWGDFQLLYTPTHGLDFLNQPEISLSFNYLSKATLQLAGKSLGISQNVLDYKGDVNTFTTFTEQSPDDAFSDSASYFFNLKDWLKHSSKRWGVVKAEVTQKGGNQLSLLSAGEMSSAMAGVAQFIPGVGQFASAGLELTGAGLMGAAAFGEHASTTKLDFQQPPPMAMVQETDIRSIGTSKASMEAVTFSYQHVISNSMPKGSKKVKKVDGKTRFTGDLGAFGWSYKDNYAFPMVDSQSSKYTLYAGDLRRLSVNGADVIPVCTRFYCSWFSGACHGGCTNMYPEVNQHPHLVAYDKKEVTNPRFSVHLSPRTMIPFINPDSPVADNIKVRIRFSLSWKGYKQYRLVTGEGKHHGLWSHQKITGQAFSKYCKSGKDCLTATDVFYIYNAKKEERLYGETYKNTDSLVYSPDGRTHIHEAMSFPKKLSQFGAKVKATVSNGRTLPYDDIGDSAVFFDWVTPEEASRLTIALSVNSPPCTKYCSLDDFRQYVDIRYEYWFYTQSKQGEELPGGFVYKSPITSLPIEEKFDP